MRWLLFLALACCDRTAPEPRAAAPPYLVVPGDRLAEGGRLADRIASVIGRGRLADALEQWSRGAEMTAACRTARCTRVAIEPLFPLDQGYVAEAVLEGSRGRVAMGEVYVGPDLDGRWRLFEAAPVRAEAGPHKVAARATVELDPHGGAISVDARLTVRPEDQRYLVFDFLPADGEVTIGAITQDGQPLRFRHLDHRLIVELIETAAESTVRFCFAGRLPAGEDRVGAGEVLLYRSWIPYLGGAARWQVEVTHPASLVLFGPVEPARTEQWSGRSRARFTAAELDRFPLLGASHYTSTSFEHRGVRIDIALWPQHGRHLAAVESATRTALDAYAALGPFPRDRFRIVEGGADAGTTALAFHSVMSLGHAALAGDHLLTTVAHELAHVWFGIEVRDPAGRWAEGVASYLSQWALPEPTARDLRWSWVVAYEQLPLAREVALAGVAEPIADDGVRRALYYGRGALLLTSLEDRIGRPAMAGILRRFHADARGTAASWADLVTATRSRAGAEHGDWLERWTSTAGAPDLALRAAARAGQAVTADLVQLGPRLYEGQVEVGFTDQAGTVLAVRSVSFSGPTTRLHLVPPDGASWLRIDPRHRLPRKPDLQRQPDRAIALDQL